MLNNPASNRNHNEQVNMIQTILKHEWYILYYRKLNEKGMYKIEIINNAQIVMNIDKRNLI